MQARKVQQEIRSYLLIALGMILYSVAALGFLVPHKIVGGGVTGLSTVIYYLSNQTIPVGITFGVVNVLLVAIALKILGPKFGVKTIFAIIVGTISMSVLQVLIPEAFVSDKFMSAIMAGIATGVGIAIALSEGGSTGGTDIVAMLITKYKNVSPEKTI